MWAALRSRRGQELTWNQWESLNAKSRRPTTSKAEETAKRHVTSSRLEQQRQAVTWIPLLSRLGGIYLNIFASTTSSSRSNTAEKSLMKSWKIWRKAWRRNKNDVTSYYKPVLFGLLGWVLDMKWKATATAIVWTESVLEIIWPLSYLFISGFCFFGDDIDWEKLQCELVKIMYIDVVCVEQTGSVLFWRLSIRKCPSRISYRWRWNGMWPSFKNRRTAGGIDAGLKG